MTNKIIIRIPSGASDRLEWISLDSENMPSSRGVCSAQQLSEMASEWQHAHITLLLPGKQCLNLLQAIPAKSQRQIKAALPYAVEEQFAEDIEALHFSIGSRSSEGDVLALVASTKSMQHWLKIFDEAGVTPKIATADHQALPQPPDAAILWVSESVSLVRLKSGVSYSIDNNMLGIILKQFSSYSEESADEEQQLDKLLVFNAENLSANLKQELSTFWDLHIDETSSETSLADPAEKELLFLAQNVEKSAAINLLQGNFRRRSPTSKNWQLWKIPAIAVTVMVVLLMSVWSIEYWSLNKKLDNLKQAHLTVYKKAFPGERRVIRPVSQMRGKMNVRGGSAKQSAFFPLMTKFSIALSKISDTEITNVNFRAKKGELKISFLAPDFAAIQKLQSELKSQQLEVSPGASNAAGDKYSGRVTIKEKS